MKRFPWKVGGRIVLALTVAPALCAGAKLSLALFAAHEVLGAAGGAPASPSAAPGAVLAGAPGGTAAPAAGTTVLAAEAAALGAATVPSGTKDYVFPMMWYLCAHELEPRAGCEPELVDYLAGVALRGYVAETCDPEPEEAPLCLEPQPWPEPARLKNAKLAAQYRLPAGGRSRDLGMNQGEAYVTALELDRCVCYALAGYPHVPADRRGAWLYNRLLEAAQLKHQLDGTRDQSELLEKFLARKEALAAKAGRSGGTVAEIRRERARVARSRELAGNALGRFDHYAKDLLTYLQPDPPAAAVEPADKDKDKDKAKSGSRKHRGT